MTYCNCNEVAISTFVVILKSVFSQYKDVNVMPIKCFQHENLFDIIKHIINGLEEMGFQELSFHNNAINEKVISFFQALNSISTPSNDI